MTAEEYLALPEEKPYLEFVNGEVIQKAMPNPDHFTLVQFLSYASFQAVRESGGMAGPEGRVEFVTGRGKEFRLPDWAYWRRERRQSTGDFMPPPTLAVEVRSPAETMAAQRDKCRYMREHGVEVCWLIDPSSRTVEVFEADLDGEARAEGTLSTVWFPGFAVDIARLFATLDG